MTSFIIKSFSIVALLLLPLTGLTQPTDTTDTVEQKQLKIGLALSGGGARGLAHIGVLKVFEEANIPVHMISGTSMGSVVGSLYSVGYSPEKLEQLALATNWNNLFNDQRFNSKNISSLSKINDYLFTFPFIEQKLNLPTGLISGQNVSMMLYRLMRPYHNVKDFTELPIPFAAVVTNLSTGKAQTITKGYLPDVVLASSAIPSIFKPVAFNGHTYIDGGVARSLPAEDTRKLGADVIISSDVSRAVQPLDSLNSFVDIMFQAVGFQQKESTKKQQKLTDFYIHPKIDRYSTFSYAQARQIIKKGEKSARKILPQIKAYLNNHNVAPSVFESIPKPSNDSLLVTDIKFSNISGMLQRQTEIALDFITPLKLTLDEIEAHVNRLYNSNLFSHISYRLQDHDGQGKKLVLDFRQQEQEQAGFSIRYDSRYRAALLFGLSLNANLANNDRLSLQLRAGEVLELSSLYSIPVSLAPLSKAKLELNLQRSPIDFYNSRQVLSTVEVEQLNLRPHILVNPWHTLNLEGGIEAEFYNLNEAVGNTLVFENTNFLLKPYLQLQYQKLNKPNFTSTGQALRVKSVLVPRGWNKTSTFLQLSGEWFSALPLAERISLQNTFWAGYTSATDVPLHYNYYLGGITRHPIFELHQFPFMGHAMQQLRTTNLLAARSELQFKISPELYLKAGFNAAHLSDSWTFNLNPGRMNYGYALSAGIDTIIGPVELSVSTPNFSDQYAVKVDIGYNF